MARKKIKKVLRKEILRSEFSKRGGRAGEGPPVEGGASEKTLPGSF